MYLYNIGDIVKVKEEYYKDIGSVSTLFGSKKIVKKEYRENASISIKEKVIYRLDGVSSIIYEHEIYLDMIPIRIDKIKKLYL